MKQYLSVQVCILFMVILTLCELNIFVIILLSFIIIITILVIVIIIIIFILNFLNGASMTEVQVSFWQLKKACSCKTEVICADHTLQLTVTMSIDNMKLIKESVSECGELDSHLHRSTLPCTYLKKACADLNINYKKVILPCKVR